MDKIEVAILDVDDHQRYDMALTEGFKHHNANIHIYSNFPTQEVRGKQFYKKNQSIFSHILSTVKSIKDAKRHNVQLLITHLSRLNSKTFCTLAIAKFYGIATAVIEHDVAPFIQGEKQYRYRMVYEYLSKHIVLHNRFAYDALLARIPQEKQAKLCLIKEGNHLEAFEGKKIPKEIAHYKMHLKKDKKYLLFFAPQLQEVHGLDLLLDALSLLKDSSIHLLIATQGERFDDYERLIKELGVGDKVHKYLNPLSDQEIDWLFGASDAIIIPHKEAYENSAILRATHYALPIIASNVGSQREMIVDRFNGLLFDNNDAKALALAIEHFFTYSYLASDLPREGFKSLRDNYRWEATAKGYLKLI